MWPSEQLSPVIRVFISGPVSVSDSKFSRIGTVDLCAVFLWPVCLSTSSESGPAM